MSVTEQNVRVKGFAVICLILLSIVLGMNSPVSAVNSPDSTWKDSPASAVSGKCAKQGLVRSGAVCLPGKAEGILNWQPKPFQGRSCVRSGVAYKTLTCNKVGSRLKWVNTTTNESASEIASAFAASMSSIQDNVLEVGMKVAIQKRDTLWSKTRALGAKLSWFDSELLPETSRGTNAQWSNNYRIDLQGQSFCYTHTSLQANNFTTVFVQIECSAALVIDDIRLPLSKALYAYRTQGDLMALTAKIASLESTYFNDGLKIDFLDSRKPKITILGLRYCLYVWSDGDGANFEGSC